MDEQTTKKEWTKFYNALCFRKMQLQRDLMHEDYSEIKSVEISKRAQINAIDLLLLQVPYDIKREATRPSRLKCGAGCDRMNETLWKA